MNICFQSGNLTQGEIVWDLNQKGDHYLKGGFGVEIFKFLEDSFQFTLVLIGQNLIFIPETLWKFKTFVQCWIFTNTFVSLFAEGFHYQQKVGLVYRQTGPGLLEWRRT